MHRFKNLFLISVLSLFLGACASAPVIEIKPFDKSVSFEGDFDQAWSQLVAFLSTNDISIGTIEKDSGLVTLSGDNLSSALISEYCDASAPFLWTLTGGNGTGSVLMTEDSGFITATVNVRFKGTIFFPQMGQSPPQYRTNPCNSRGAFETAVLGSLQ
jgi:hypothetical protein|tara:strand:+ start:250 stop:723 length:474 start_codon:yes stop_codon:yes gene_type:complete